MQDPSTIRPTNGVDEFFTGDLLYKAYLETNMVITKIKSIQPCNTLPLLKVMIFPTGDLEGLRRHNVVNLVCGYS